MSWNNRLQLVRVLLVATLCGMGYMGYKVAEPYFVSQGYQSPGDEEPKLKLPKYDVSAWAELPVLAEGRVKPLQTAAIESVRSITGRATFEKNDAVSVFLSWLFYDANHAGKPGVIDWDNYPFILCEDMDLRAAIYGVKVSDEAAAKKVHGKFISPRDLYQSLGFQRIIVEVRRKQEKDRENFRQSLESIERKANSVLDRLQMYETITGTLESRDPKVTSRKDPRYLLQDPVHYVALDKVKDSAWFSIGELRYLMNAKRAPMLDQATNSKLVWEEIMQQRVGLQPRLYLPAEVLKSLADLQAAIKSGKTESVVSELQAVLVQRSEKQQPKMIEQAVREEMIRLKVNDMTEEEFQKLAERSGQKMTKDDLKKKMTDGLGTDIKKQQTFRNDKTIRDLKERLAGISKPYVADDPKYNQMYMDYLEARYPEMYELAIKSQPFPASAANTVLASYDAVSDAYWKGESSSFAAASKAFFETINKVSKETTGNNYPGENTTALELLLNRVEPFKWAWISMLLAAILFGLSLKLDNKILYQVGFVPLVVSLGFQLFAYYSRIAISGRPPVSNMFETVIFVATMGTVFSLLLECFYRNKVIILSGAIIGTLGMILADQLPTVSGFDSKISPLTPVLRSNYWLIIHVMTIVASYAAGALAWVIGNISLIMYWFNSDRRDLLKTLANLCYSAIKVAVLLLGVGTLLGGIWAAESWGRFWGWDPKETWALIALVSYLLPLHARYIGWIKDFGLAVTSVVCFSGIVMSWYGVNFILGAGLHAYGMGDGGPWTIFLLGLVNLFWVLMVCHRRAMREVVAA